mgnify:FL=1
MYFQFLDKDVVLKARITGNPKVETEWFFNGQKINDDGDKYKMERDGDRFSLNIKNIKREDCGFYRCCAFNRAGKADCVAQLNIKKEM